MFCIPFPRCSQQDALPGTDSKAPGFWEGLALRQGAGKHWRPKLTSGSSEGRGVKTHRHHRSPAEQQVVTGGSRLGVPVI